MKNKLYISKVWFVLIGTLIAVMAVSCTSTNLPTGTTSAPTPTTNPVPQTGVDDALANNFPVYPPDAKPVYEINTPVPTEITPTPLPEAAETSSNFVTLQDFTTVVSDGAEGTIRGVYIPEVLALRVVQQPAGDPNYVSSMDGVVTQFSQATQMNVTGLLAHNYAAGAFFSDISPDDDVFIIYGDGFIVDYRVVSVQAYQALDPDSPVSTFVSLDTGETLTAYQLFFRVYSGTPHVTFQTCISNGEEDSWGRLFIIAEPVD